MTFMHSLLFMLHIVVGSMALFLFWIPIVSKKGGLDHKKFGRYYSTVMYSVAISGALMAILVIAAPLTIKAQMVSAASDPDKAANSIRMFYYFLLYLSLITFVSVRHGNTVLRVKSEKSKLRLLTYKAPLIILLLSASILTVYGLLNARILFVIFGGLGIAIAWGMLRYCHSDSNKGTPWVAEHLGAMIGSGIGAYTAFIAFGGRQLFSELGQWQLIFWIAPGVIGSLYIAKLSRRYY